MSATAIRIEDLGKKYRVGTRERYRTLRDTIATGAALRRRNDAKREASTIWALRHVSLDVGVGEALGVIGPNGAGKTTLLKILARITEPTEGSVEIRGRVRSLLEVGTGFHPELTGKENIFLNGAILGMGRREIQQKFDEIVEFAEIHRFIDTPVKRYSSGMYIRLAFSVAAHLESEIIVVDEVLAVGDEAFQKKCLGRMDEITGHGRTVIFVSHNMVAIQALCRRAILLGSGSVVASGPTDEVVGTYMGSVYDRLNRPSMDQVVMNDREGIGIASCKARIEGRDGHSKDLCIEMEVVTDRFHRNVGVGVSFQVVGGPKASVLAPSVTNFVIREVHGTKRCLITCRDINGSLAAGDYVLGFWLSKRGVRLVKNEEALLVSIPGRDLYGTGRHFDSRRHGVAPLKAEFVVRNDRSEWPHLQPVDRIPDVH